MGVDYSATLVAGVEWKAIMNLVEEPIAITKYHEDTGVPYQIANTLRYYRLPDGQQLSYDEDEQEWLEERGLEVFTPTHFSDWPEQTAPQKVIGCAIACVEGQPKDWVRWVTLKEQELGFAEARNALSSLGYKGEINLCLVLNASV